MINCRGEELKNDQTQVTGAGYWSPKMMDEGKRDYLGGQLIHQRRWKMVPKKTIQDRN